jgi:hypothetical protein
MKPPTNDIAIRYSMIESKDFPDHWHVEAIESDGAICMAVFSGPKAHDRAAEYMDWKNGIRHPAAVLQLKRR